MRVQIVFVLSVLPALFLAGCGGGGGDAAMADQFVGQERLVGVIRFSESGSDFFSGSPVDVRIDAGGGLILASLAADGTATVPGRVESPAEIDALQEVLGNGNNDTISTALANGNRLVRFGERAERALLVRVYPVDLDPTIPDLQGIQLTALETEVRSATRTPTSIALDIVVRLYGIDTAEDEDTPEVNEVALGLYTMGTGFAPAPAALSPVHLSIRDTQKVPELTALGTYPEGFEGRGALIRASDNLGWFSDFVRDGSGSPFLFFMFVDGGGGAGSSAGGEARLIPLVPEVGVDFSARPVTGVRFHSHKVGLGTYDGPSGPVPTYESEGVLIVYGPTAGQR